MKRLPSPPIVAWSLSGFVVGVLSTLLATGVLGGRSSSTTPTPVSTPVPVHTVADTQLKDRLTKIAVRVLGPSFPAGGGKRLLNLQIGQPLGIDPDTERFDQSRGYRSVKISFRLNDHPLGPTWRLREAKADIFSTLKAIYTSGLPVYDTILTGTYRTSRGKDYQALVVLLSHQKAVKLPWRRWNRSNEQTLWAALDYRHVDRRFG